MNDLDTLAPEFSQMNLKKAKSMGMKGFGIKWDDGEKFLNRTPSKLRNTMNAEDLMPKSEQKSPSFYSLDYAENNDQMRLLRAQERSLRSTASTSHIPPFHPENEIGDHEFALPNRSFDRAQSMRFPPGLDIDSVLDDFGIADTPMMSQPQRMLKRNVTFAGNLKSRTHADSLIDDVSDDEDVDVSVIDDEMLMDISRPRLRGTVSYGNMKRVNSAQKMRAAFPKTVFDNVDVQNPPGSNDLLRHPSIQRMNSSGSIKSNSSATSASNSFSPNRRQKQVMYEPEPDIYNMHHHQPQVPQYYDGRMSPPSYGLFSGSQSPPPMGGYADPYSQQMMMNPLGGYGYEPSTSPNMYDQQNHLMQQTMQNRILVDLALKQSAMLQSLQQQQQQQQSGFMMPQQQGRYGSTSPVGGMKKPESFTDRNVSNLLIRHKTNGYRPTLQELRGHVVEFSRDSHGSRLVQCLMEAANIEEKEILIGEVLPEAVSLMQDLFGNYVMQNFLEHCNEGQRTHLAAQIQKSMNLLSFQPHGCRVVQRAIDILDSDTRNELLKEVVFPNDQIARCAKDPHATHVLQKAVVLLQRELKSGEKNETNKINFEILESIEKILSDDVLQMAVHPHACRLVQKVLGDCVYDRSPYVASMLTLIRKVYPTLSVDQHGNFILQHILDHGDEEQKNEVHAYVCSKFLELAQHKFGSHLVEKCLNAANAKQAESLVKELLAPALALRAERGENLQFDDKDGDDMLLTLMKDPYANFVVQRAFDASEGNLRKHIIKEVQDRSEILSRFTYGRHILSHVNKN